MDHSSDDGGSQQKQPVIDGGDNERHPKNVYVLPAAAEEAREARRWYAEHAPQVEDAFVAALDRAVEHIAEGPQVWPRSEDGTRRFHLQRFPYSVMYRESKMGIEIVAVAHDRRRPGYWRRRG